MPLLKYYLYQKILNSNLTKCEIDELIKTIYSICNSYLKYRNKSSTQINKNKTIEFVIDVSVSLLKERNNKMTDLSNLLENCKEYILTEADLNYWIMNLVIKKTEKFIVTVL